MSFVCRQDKCHQPAQIAVRIWYGQRDEQGEVEHYPMYCLDVFCSEHTRWRAGSPDELHEFKTDMNRAEQLIHTHYTKLRQDFLYPLPPSLPPSLP
jgi:hypothetical protein